MQKFDKRSEKTILKALDALAKKHGPRDTAHAVNKWTRARLVRNSVEKERQKLRKRLAELEAQQ